MATLRQVNASLFNAGQHLFEASKHLSNVPEMREDALRLLLMAQAMISVIEPEEQKVTQDRMESILSEIIDFGGDPE